MITFEIPTRIILGVKKKTSFPLNVNAFANKHHQQKHNAKNIFYEYIDGLNLKDKHGELSGVHRVHYQYYAETGRLFDEANVGGGIDKFLADALVNCGLLVDDNYEHLKHYTFEFVGVKKREWPDHRLKGLAVVTVSRV